MFISIRRYLESRPQQLADALLRMVQGLLRSIELHAVKGDAADYERFRNDVRKVQERLGEHPPAADVLVATGAIAKAMEEYNIRTSRFIQVQCAELQTMVGMLIRAVAAVSSASENSVARLHGIVHQLHQASLIEDFQTVRTCLSECLENLRGEILRQQEDSGRMLLEMRTELEKCRKCVGGVTAAPGTGSREDPVTGLPERAEAEAALLEAAQQGRPAYAVLIVVERLDLINMRTGTPPAIRSCCWSASMWPEASPGPTSCSDGAGRRSWHCWSGALPRRWCGKKSRGSPAGAFRKPSRWATAR